MPLLSVGPISDLHKRLMDVKSRSLGLLSPAHPESGSAVVHLLEPQLVFSEVLSMQREVTKGLLCLRDRNTDY